MINPSEPEDPTQQAIDRHWREHAQEYIDFVNANGRQPAKRADDYDEDRLYGWRSAQRRAKDDLPTWRVELLDAAVPGWDEQRDWFELWVEQAELVQAFIAEHGRWPHPDAADDDERKLGRWGDRQRAAGSKLQQERREYLEAHLTGWEQKPARIAKAERRPRQAPQGLSPEDAWLGEWPEGHKHWMDSAPETKVMAIGVPDELTRQNWEGRRFPRTGTYTHAFDDAFEYLVGSVMQGKLATGRPGKHGVETVVCWLGAIEWRMDGSINAQNVADFRAGFTAGIVTLISSKLGLPNEDREAFAHGRFEPDHDLYLEAQAKLVRSAVSADDLALWRDGVTDGRDGHFWRGQVMSAVALSQLDRWWGLRHRPGGVTGEFGDFAEAVQYD